MPAHSHSATINASTDDGNSASPDGALLAFAECTNYDSDGPMSQVPMSSSMVSVGNAGGSQAHNNMPPYVTITACVATQGIYPSRN
jgi:microcystin-dependent protein